MTIYVPTAISIPGASACQVGAPPSALRLGVPAADSVNHVYAHLLGGVRILQRCLGTPTDTDDTLSYTIHRHALCDYVDFDIQIVTGAAEQTEDWVLTVTCGDGDAVTASSGYVLSEGPGLVRIRAPWGTTSVGEAKVTIVYEDCAIRSVMAYDVPRETLETTDGGCHYHDGTYHRVGPIADGYLADSDVAGPSGYVAQIRAAWDAYYPQISAEAWSAADAPTATGGSYSAFTAYSVRTRPRPKRSSDLVNISNWYVYTYCTAGVTYALQLSGGADSAEATGLTGTSAELTTFADFELDSTDYDSVILEGKITAGSGTVYLISRCGILDP